MHTVDSDTRSRILEAATARFRQYGFGKTTMAEIADDCGMSAANLYRYFENKQAIGTAIACGCVDEMMDRLRRVARGQGSAADRLERFLLTALSVMYDNRSTQPRMAELIENLVNGQGEMLHEVKIRPMASLLAEILADGAKTGEFAVDDVVQTAQTVLAATVAFHAPFIVMAGVFTREQMEQMARDVARLLVKGLKTR
ncbi:MAG: TetR/AcrR family transcriptional regulator [Nitrospirota bacterium]|nr:TetR/AcrR family transcriptional regulator [Nitrospirota bacterium]